MKSKKLFNHIKSLKTNTNEQVACDCNSRLPDDNGMGQAPQRISYQAVVCNAANGLITNTAVGICISIMQGLATGMVVYLETNQPNPVTNANGLVSSEVGGACR